ncbi:6789_t:CDS:2 [Paraglomus brasilianum]|uniref:6789_t:CDS:1 n=1 Tax=Paraglomus brasilianum TaxID=144538 RepID=A0A9N8VCY7_9GLOM|nr:6789_t:CDS:2 [Paraglomus brasilianum]
MFFQLRGYDCYGTKLVEDSNRNVKDDDFVDRASVARRRCAECGTDDAMTLSNEDFDKLD